MRGSILACTVCLLIAACTSRTSSNVPAGANSPAVRWALQAATAPLPDSAFVETRRDTVYGFRTVQGGCVFSSSDSGAPGVIHEMHTLSVDRMCRSVRAVGYRKAMPPDTDTVGYESISASSDLDSAAIARLRRRR